MSSRPIGRVEGFVACTVALGAAAVVAALVETAADPPPLLAFLCICVLLAELLEVTSDEASPHAIDTQKFSFSSSVHLAALLLIGPWGAALVAAVGVAGVDGIRGRPFRQIAFNVSAFALSCVGAGAAFVLLGGSPGSLTMPNDLIAIAGMVVAYATINTILVGTVVAFAGNTRVWPLVRDTSEAELPTVTAEASLGFSIAFFALASPWYPVLLLPLLLAVYQSHAGLAQMRRETGRALETFANVIDERDPYTFQHSARVAEYARELAERLGFSATDVSRLRWAGRLHDLGKISVDAHVLRKPGRLDPREWEAMRRHPRLSARLIRRFRFAHEEARAVEYHHERFDGAGYYGVDGQQLPLAAHFLIIADTYDAMTSDRPYRSAMTPEAALAEIEENLGTQFHPAIGRAFVALQRGLDPAKALSAAELSELHDLFERSRPLRQRLRRIPPGPDSVALLGLAAAFGLAGLGHPFLAAASCAGSAAGICWKRLRLRRASALAETLAGAAIDARPSELMRSLARGLVDHSSLDWIGLLHWRESELDGSVVAEWGNNFAAPLEAALTSWLVRDLTPVREVLVADGVEVGRGGVLYALPVGEPGRGSGFLVFLFRQWPPVHVDLALRRAAEGLAAAFDPVVPSARIRVAASG